MKRQKLFKLSKITADVIARNLLSRLPHRVRSERGPASGSVGGLMTLLQNERYQEALHIARDIVATIDGTADQIPDSPRKLADVMLESVRESLAYCPTVRPHEESAFLRQGDYWTIRHQGHAANLKATRGLDCLRYLLHHPGREIHVCEFLATLIEVTVPALPGSEVIQ